MFLDDVNIPPSGKRRHLLSTAIVSCKALVPIYTTNNTLRHYHEAVQIVQSQVSIASKKGIPVIPITLTAVEDLKIIPVINKTITHTFVTPPDSVQSILLQEVNEIAA